MAVIQKASAVTEKPPPTRAARGRLRRVGRLALDLGVSPLAYYGLSALGVASVHALLAAAIVAACWVLLTALLDGKVDGLALFILAMYGVMFALAAAAHDERLLLTRDPLTSGLAGLLFLGSCATSTPATAYLATKLHGGQPADPRVRRAHVVESLVLGVGLLAEAAVRMVLVFVLPVDVAAGLGPAIEFVVLPVLVAWMFWHRRRAAAPPNPRRTEPTA
ncbi:VC0807 family protein [Streptomyces cacaoi]